MAYSIVIFDVKNGTCSSMHVENPEHEFTHRLELVRLSPTPPAPGQALARSGRHWEPATPDPISKGILATKLDFKSAFEDLRPPPDAEFHAGSTLVQHTA